MHSIHLTNWRAHLRLNGGLSHKKVGWRKREDYIILLQIYINIYCQAQPQLQLSWAEMVFNVNLTRPTHPPQRMGCEIVREIGRAQ